MGELFCCDSYVSEMPLPKLCTKLPSCRKMIRECHLKVRNYSSKRNTTRMALSRHSPVLGADIGAIVLAFM